MTGWEDFIEPYNEKIIAAFRLKKKNLTTVIGTTNSRSFLWQYFGRETRFISSSLEISIIEYYEKRIPIIAYIISIAIIIIGFALGLFGLILSFVGFIGLIVCIARNKFSIISTWIGGEHVSLRSRRKIEEIVEFIRLVHSQTGLGRRGITGPRQSKFAPEKLKKLAVGLVGVLIIILVLIPIIIFGIGF
ncbi:MAG: hypothetical protein ACTSQJ_18250 [Promethearchaeota archaeon]